MENKKYTVITGASSGIGYEAAKAFASRNKNLVLIARRAGKLENLKNELQKEHTNIDIMTLPCDLSIKSNVYTIFSELENYELETWINNAGFGMYGELNNNEFDKIEEMLQLNIEAVTLFSALFVKKYQDIEGTQLINISSAGGYTVVPTAVVYCATKFFVSAFTEGLSQELIQSGAKMRAKVLAPAATSTEFGKVANGAANFDYDQAFGTYHSSQEMARFLLNLYDGNYSVGHVNRETFEFELTGNRLPYAGQSKNNQKQSLSKK